MTSLILLLSLSPLAQNQPYTLSVDVDLVLFNVTVLDDKDRPVSGLTQTSFQIYEDGKRQDIKFFRPEDIPATIGLVIDNSGSMVNKRSEVVKAAIEFVQSSNAKDELFIVNFNERPFMGLPDSVPFTNDFTQLRAALERIYADGRTALYDGIATALEHLEKGAHQRKALVVLSDGGDNASRRSLEEVHAMAEQSSATIYTIGIYDPWEREKNPGVLRQLSRLTGAESYALRDVRDLDKIWQRIANGIRSQYTIGYNSTNPGRDGTFRSVKISALRKDGKPLKVRTRPGYVASKQ
jgi:VWFA-related protein